VTGAHDAAVIALAAETRYKIDHGADDDEVVLMALALETPPARCPHLSDHDFVLLLASKPP
jgi:hypothetical protein